MLLRRACLEAFFALHGSKDKTQACLNEFDSEFVLASVTLFVDYRY
jgi:hypothetical protein